MMAHDEIRTLNWDQSCASLKLDAGPLLADQVKRCTGWLAGSEVYVWSDMFDPFHNAHGNYYLVRGDLTGSWEGLSPSVTIVNWNFDKRDESLKFFADRGHRQVIAGYYDAPPEQVKEWLDSASKVKGQRVDIGEVLRLQLSGLATPTDAFFRHARAVQQHAQVVSRLCHRRIIR